MQTKNEKKKEQKRKPKRPVVMFTSYAVIALSLYLIYGVVKEVFTTIKLRQQLAEVKQELEIISSENEQLISQKSKLEDPNYVQSYARGNYMVSKEGEKIFYLPSSEDSNDK